jgi:hypothetical protein
MILREAWRDAVPPNKFLPLSFEGEGDTGGEVRKPRAKPGMIRGRLGWEKINTSAGRGRGGHRGSGRI